MIRPKSLASLLLFSWLLCIAGCGGSRHLDGPLAPADANGDGRITVGELDDALADRLEEPGGRAAEGGRAGALVLECDRSPRDSVINTDAERLCIEAHPLWGAPALRVRDVLAQRRVVPRAGRMWVLGLDLALVLAAPWVAGRVVNGAGWRFRRRTKGAWFRIPAGWQWLLCGVSGAILGGIATVILLVVSLGLPWSWDGRAAAFLTLSARSVIAFVVIGAGAALARGVKIAGDSTRILRLEVSTPGPAQSARAASAPAQVEHPRRPVPKNILICCDGTGNRAEAMEGTVRVVSNVRRFYEFATSSADSRWHQEKWYDDGVGTGTSGESKRIGLLARLLSWIGQNTPVRVVSVLEKLRMVYELGFGIGITENISQAYRQIVRMYEPGDRIFLVGFSRGAYTARCVADVIDDVGLLKAEHIRFAPDVVQFYRYRTGTDQHVALRPELLHENVQIEFLGLWDTVASLGVPLWGWSFSVGGLWSNEGFGVTDITNCKVVRHALSMDEERSQFFPTLFDESSVSTRGGDIQQRWFRGSHSGVGGGYVDSSLSDISLQWMMQEATAHHLLVDGGWQQTLHPNDLGAVITQIERQRAWRLSGAWPRWHPCDTADARRSEGFGVLDGSVVLRSAHAASLRAEHAPVGSDELFTLSIGERATVAIRADQGWQRSGVVMERGGRYRVRYVGGLWRDREGAFCGPAGQDATGRDIRRGLNWGKRYVPGRWMELVGHVAHPRVWPARELPASRLLKYLVVREPHELTASLIPLGHHLETDERGVDVVMSAPAGVFYAFANDWWLFYDNNSGSIVVEIERVCETSAQTPCYVVSEDGTVTRLPSVVSAPGSESHAPGTSQL
ncbi:MAG: DUF2235 domain-containing protein [Vicinamibacterales bacterium]